MDIELVEQIVDYITKLATPLVTAGYELVIKQVYYQMYFDIFINAVLLVIFIFGIKFCKKVPSLDWAGGEFMVAFILTFPPLAVFCTNMASILNTLINPDWVAIKLLMSLVSK